VSYNENVLLTVEFIWDKYSVTLGTIIYVPPTLRYVHVSYSMMIIANVIKRFTNEEKTLPISVPTTGLHNKIVISYPAKGHTIL
jgi:hypothetical protein